jgi:lipopolysaccharide transport system ATP-binding protein
LSSNADIAIRVEGLGKRYRYGGVAPLSSNLRADITDWAKGLLRRGRAHRPTLQQVHEQHIAESPEYFWALKDINIEVKRGEVVGIIGRNGAGKSTLLKILSRITPPTVGKVEYYGRMASLLEVGTGFHRELTGRENIYLNGSILGMKHAEITRRFDDIVAFAEVEKFIDTPVKFYSSGMYVRLAFAVAAHLDPETLLVDEVLAVGDADFQRKCIGKMQDVSAKQGRTVLFVSHNMAAVQNLCMRALLFSNGSLEADGPTETVIKQYLTSAMAAHELSLASRTDREGTGDLRFTMFRVLGANGNEAGAIPCGGGVTFDLAYQAHRRVNLPMVFLSIYDVFGNLLVNLNSRMSGLDCDKAENRGRFLCHVPELPLPAGQYRINIAVTERLGAILDRVVNAGTLTVASADFFGTGCDDPSGGKFLLRHNWRHTNAA